MKVANIIVVHKNPTQCLRLINQYDGRLFHHFIHLDRKCRIADWQDVVNHPDVTLLKRRRRMVYTGYGFVGATLDALYAIRSSGERFFYINLISGMDFPLRSTDAFYDFLKTTYETEPKEFFEILDLSVWPGAVRYQKYHLINWTIRGRYFTERIINWFIPRRKFYKGKLVPYGRASWFTATDHFIDYALKYLDENPGYIRFLKSCWCPDEFIFNSIIMASPFRDRISHYLRYIDWSEGKVTPKLFRVGDLDVLLASGCFMARKFDEAADSAILDRLEGAIAGEKSNHRSK